MNNSLFLAIDDLFSKIKTPAYFKKEEQIFDFLNKNIYIT